MIGDDEHENQETRETPALSPDEVTFTREDAESVGDPAAAGADAEGEPAEAPEPAPTAATDPTPPGGNEVPETEVPEPEPPATEPEPEAPAAEAPAAEAPATEAPETEAPAGSPAAAQERAEAGETSPLERPEVQVLAAFLGAFVLAQILKRLLGRD